MKHLKPLPQSPQDGYGVLNCRLVNEDDLESPLQRSILLNVLAIFVKRGRSYQMELATGQHWLEHISGVH